MQSIFYAYVEDNRGGNSPPRSGVSMLTAMFFARASRGRMAVGRVTAAILPLAKRGEERRVHTPRSGRRGTICCQFYFAVIDSSSPSSSISTKSLAPSTNAIPISVGR
jgi:hypothetical protein